MEDEDQNISFYENLVAISGFTKCLLASTYAYLLRKKNKIQIAQGLANLALEQKSYDKIYTRRWLSIKNQRGKWVIQTFASILTNNNLVDQHLLLAKVSIHQTRTSTANLFSTRFMIHLIIVIRRVLYMWSYRIQYNK